MDRSTLRDLPPVNALLDRPELAQAVARRGRGAVLEATRTALAEARQRLLSGLDAQLGPAELAGRALEILAGERPVLRRVINATGTLLHTGLGRAPLAPEAAEAISEVVRGYCNLEFDLDRGERGRRAEKIAALLRRVTGAEAAAVVNNNAGATVLALRALAAGREVVVSRGQLVEIGGSFRLPEIFEVSGARLREVGTTNKTRLVDYERAIGPETAALLRVHPSNYRIVGFTEEAPIGELAALAHARSLWAIDDIGSGALGPDRPRVADEPNVAASLSAGADVVLFSGDKLLGGPQCGILAGSARAIALVQADPLMRALRVDKMTLAALEATLRLALESEPGSQRIPLWAFLEASLPDLLARAERLAERLTIELGLNAEPIETLAYLGGGSVPVSPIPSAAVRLSPPFPGPSCSEAELARKLRLGEPAVVPRLQGGAVLIDLRAMTQAEDAEVFEAVRSALRHPPAERPSR